MLTAHMIISTAVRCISASVVGALLAMGSVVRADEPANVDQPVDQLMSQLTPEEKISLLHGYKGFYTGEIQRLNIPATKMTDGPVGTRNDGASTAYPAGV